MGQATDASLLHGSQIRAAASPRGPQFPGRTRSADNEGQASTIAIFKGVRGLASVQVETVATKDEALGRLIELCASTPDDYFAVSNGQIVGEASLFEPDLGPA
jgi:hypothetical protein